MHQYNRTITFTHTSYSQAFLFFFLFMSEQLDATFFKHENNRKKVKIFTTFSLMTPSHSASLSSAVCSLIERDKKMTFLLTLADVKNVLEWSVSLGFFKFELVHQKILAMETLMFRPSEVCVVLRSNWWTLTLERSDWLKPLIWFDLGALKKIKAE